MKLNYGCNECHAKWTTSKTDEDYCPKCLSNNIKVVSRMGGSSAYDLSG